MGYLPVLCCAVLCCAVLDYFEIDMGLGGYGGLDWIGLD